MGVIVNIPNPGSEEAIKQGCSCPVLDNNHGRGVSQGGGEPLFWMDDGCILHGAEASAIRASKKGEKNG